MKSLNHWVFSAPLHAKFLRQYTKYSLADILVFRERKILQAFCGLESSNLRRLLTNIGSINFVAGGIKQSHIHKVCSSLLYPHCFAFLLPLFVKEVCRGYLKFESSSDFV